MKYKHTQIGWVIMIVLLLVTFGIFASSFFVDEAFGKNILMAGGLLFLVLSGMFSTLTVEITQYELKWYFGPIPLIKRSIELSDILSVKKTKTKIIEGWGIHYTRRGWLYNVSGRDAILITKSDGTTATTAMIGTDEPETLIKMLGH
ncbi:MAG: hypothetical protein CMI52_01970 [Parcubacteria group bacterium]|nr:hypothetical protein [Parcubacteria group bacterium]|tara:strand:- start:599 stop:1039 length:441 start_codon:yes stop_codon:yes gene_type:complete